MNIGYMVVVEAWFDGEVDAEYVQLDENAAGYLYMVSNVMGSGYDHFIFMDGEDDDKRTKAFIKKLKGIGVPADQITKYKIAE